MAALDPDKILELIREVGLAPTKAKNLWLAANDRRSGGEVIGDREFLEALPGIGHKTASVVMSQAFGVPAFAVDAHVHRLAERWGLSNGTSVERTEADLKAVFPIETWNDRHLQIIFSSAANTAPPAATTSPPARSAAGRRPRSASATNRCDNPALSAGVRQLSNTGSIVRDGETAGRAISGGDRRRAST